MRKLTMFLLAVGLFALGCEARTDKQDGGGVLLSISDFDGLPVTVSVNAALATGTVSIGQITLQSIVKNPAAPTSSLQNIEIDTYEVRYSRADGGTRLPPPFVRRLFGVVPVSGTEVYDNLPVMTLEQLNATPLRDLQVINGGFDKETGGVAIRINLEVRFFGRTLSGDAADTPPAGFTVEFVP